MNIRSFLILLAFLLLLIFSWWFYIYKIKLPDTSTQVNNTEISANLDTSNIFCPDRQNIASYFGDLKSNLGSNDIAIFSLDQLKGESDEDFANRFMAFERVVSENMDAGTYQINRSGNVSNLSTFDIDNPSFQSRIERGVMDTNVASNIEINSSASSNWPLKRLIRFDGNNEVIDRRKNRRLLSQYVNALNNNDYQIKLIGRTDCRGSKETGLLRAQALKDLLVAQGISGDRITIESMGSKCPLASNLTEEGKKINNSVEICKIN